MQIVKYNLGRTDLRKRPIPPTLIGTDILSSHIITLDYPNAPFLTSPHNAPVTPKAKISFALMVNGHQVEVSRIFEASVADKTGLKLGDKVVAIDGMELSVETDEERCETSLWLSNELDLSRVKTLTILRGNVFVDVNL